MEAAVLAGGRRCASVPIASVPGAALQHHARVRALQRTARPGCRECCDFAFVLPPKGTPGCFLALVGDLAGAPAALDRIKRLWHEAYPADESETAHGALTSRDLTVLNWSPFGSNSECRIAHAVFEDAERVAEYTHALVVGPDDAVWATAPAASAAGPDAFNPFGRGGSPPVSMHWGRRALAALDGARTKGKNHFVFDALPPLVRICEIWPLFSDEVRMSEEGAQSPGTSLWLWRPRSRTTAANCVLRQKPGPGSI